MLLHPPCRPYAIILAISFAGVLIPSSEAARAFIAPPGQQFDPPTPGNTLVYMAPGTTLHLNAWIDGPYRSGNTLAFYQLVFQDAAIGGENGSVVYVDTDPGQGGGDTIFLDTRRDDWVFPTFLGVIPRIYLEADPIFGLIFNTPICLACEVRPQGVNYLCEFDIVASEDARGTFEFRWNVPDTGGRPPYSALFAPGGANFDPTLAFQNLTVVVSPCGDGRKTPPEECDDGNLINGDGCSSLCVLEPVTVPTLTPQGVVLLIGCLVTGVVLRSRTHARTSTTDD